MKGCGQTKRSPPTVGGSHWGLLTLRAPNEREESAKLHHSDGEMNSYTTTKWLDVDLEAHEVRHCGISCFLQGGTPHGLDDLGSLNKLWPSQTGGGEHFFRPQPSLLRC